MTLIGVLGVALFGYVLFACASMEHFHFIAVVKQTVAEIFRP
jgi:hypothetical protein